MTDDQEANAGHMTFKGDRRESYVMTRPIQRPFDFKIVWPVSIEYDADKDQTRVGFSTQVPEHLLQGRDD